MLQLLDAEVKPFEDVFLKGLRWSCRDLILQRVEVDEKQFKIAYCEVKDSCSRMTTVKGINFFALPDI